ncbi:hypothetical protein Dimus_008244 [Dionaea muscipula]
MFARRDLVFKSTCREFYKNVTVRLSNKKDVATTVASWSTIELDCMTLASILKIPGNFGLSDYVKEVWEEARDRKSLEITRKFSNDETITKVPLDDKEGDEPVKTNFFEETFLNMHVTIKRENGVWWLGSGANRRRDDEVNEMENEENEEEAEDTDEVEDKGQNQPADFDWEVVNEDVHVEGEQVEKEDDSVFGEKFFDAMDDVEDLASVTDPVPDVIAPAPAILDVSVSFPNQKKEKTSSGVDPSSPFGRHVGF